MALTPFGFPAYNEPVSQVTLTNSVQLGSVRFEAGEEYVYAFNAGNSQISVGNLAVLSAATGMSVTVSSVTNYDYPIGFVKHATILTAQYGWLLTKGFTNVKNGMASTALAVADPLFVAANGTVQAVGVSTTALCGVTGGIGGLYPIGTVVQATGSAGTGYAFVRCFGT